VGGRRVELTAYDDGGDAQTAVERARQLALDPQVMAVIGHYRVETTRAAYDVYAREALPLIAPVIPSDALPGAPCADCNHPAALRTGPLRAALNNSPGLDEVMAGGLPGGAIFSTGARWPQDAPDAQAFIARYRAASNGVEPGPYAWATYEAVNGLFAALERSGGSGVTRRAVGARLARDFDARGVRPSPVFMYRLDERGRPVLQAQKNP
jgi:ABC-type branched-subunit amino acid transport system substrate-binding protein